MAHHIVNRIVITSFLILLLSACHTVNNANRNDHALNPDRRSEDTLSEKGSGEELSVCTFNIQFLGAFKKRDNTSLADLLKNYDIVAVQELVAPPVDGNYPDGSSYKADPESAAFMEAMKMHGFSFILSEEDTGSGEKIHSAGTGTEWFICFYDSSSVTTDPDLPHGFLATDRSDNPDFERVPYAFSFRSLHGRNDFVLISVHLDPGDSQPDRTRRKHEISTIYHWISSHNQTEKDFFILGDMNIEDKGELMDLLPPAMKSLNDECRVTNTLVNNDPPDFGGKPYDQVFYFPAYSGNEVDTTFDCKVIDLKEEMKNYWKGPGAYPGDPYDHNLFRQYFSDHDPLVFKIRVTSEDDD